MRHKDINVAQKSIQKAVRRYLNAFSDLLTAFLCLFRDLFRKYLETAKTHENMILFESVKIGIG